MESVFPKRSKAGQIRDRFAEIDAHKAAFIVAGISTGLDIFLALAALYPNSLHDVFKGFPFVDFDIGNENNQDNLVLTTALPIIAAIFSVILIMGNKLKVWTAYPLYLLFNTLLLFWNLFVVITIYAHVIPEVYKQETRFCERHGSCSNVARKLYIYSFFLVFSFILECIFDFVVWRGWRVLKASMND